MDYPKIKFIYSWIYDQKWREWIKIYQKKKVYRRKIKKCPSAKEIQGYIKKVEKIWQENEKKILVELSRITRLKWKSKFIYCYVVGKCIPFSDPLTLPVYEKDPNYFIDTLIHKLIHGLFTDGKNLEQSKKAWSYIFRGYKNNSDATKIHIPLHAIHSYIYLKFFTTKRLKKNIKLISFLSDYKKSWEIVQKEGYKNIINEFAKRIK